MSKVKFGLRVPEFPLDGSSGEAFRNQIIGYLEKVGPKYDSAWVCDHFTPWAWWIRDPETTPNLECMTSISYLSALFPKLDFGSLVLCNGYRHPSVLAQMGGTLQALTGGRFILGIGAGWKEDEYVTHGLEFPKPSVRIKQLAEGVQVIRSMWTQDDPHFVGEFYRIDHAYCQPRPDPAPPIMIGGGGEKLLLRVVAKHADWWNLSAGDIDRYSHKLKVLKGHCDEIGRDFDEIVPTWSVETVGVGDSEEEASRLIESNPFGPPVPTGSSDKPVPTDPTAAMVIGTADRVSEIFQLFVDAGCRHFIIRFVSAFPETEQAERFAEEVIPRFR
ncbi:MAG: LLM class flavin-dependent oxidoreductase [Anaerolineales bacterium]|nr:LLM class flavin-dependent oxidoreductase [Anaerolineales bacterium]